MRPLLICISLITCFACGQKSTTPQPQHELHDRVLDIHDEAMILMGPIYSKIKGLRFVKDSTELPYDESADQLIHQLVESEEAMMDWMSEWKTPALDSASASTMSYLEKEEQKIIAIKELMSQSIHRADSFLNETKTQI